LDYKEDLVVVVVVVVVVEKNEKNWRGNDNSDTKKWLAKK
jgi:hypothetical protein